MSVSKFSNIGIGGLSNIGNWPNQEKKFFENIGIGSKNYIRLSLLY